MENDLGWYYAGLLPYVSMRLVLLSPHVSDQQLEKHIWIRPERSLARMAMGLITSAEIRRGSGVGCTGKQALCDELAMNLSEMILSGQWLPYVGYWAQIFFQVKRWAFGVETGSTECSNVLFGHHECIEDTRILSAIPRFGLIPTGLEKEESIIKTTNEWFLTEGYCMESGNARHVE